MFYAVQQLEHTETLIVGLFQKSQLTGKALEIDEMLEGHLTQLLKDGDVSSKPNQVSKVFPPSSAGMKRIYFVGLGREANYSFEQAKERFAHVFQAIHKDRKQEAAVLLDTFISEDVPPADAAQALAESCCLRPMRCRIISTNQMSLTNKLKLCMPSQRKIHKKCRRDFVSARPTGKGQIRLERL